jgi:hypothetical protein
MRLYASLTPSPSLGAMDQSSLQTLEPGLDPQNPISQYVHDVWQIDQGLPQSGSA